MGPFENALDRLGIILPAVPKPVASYVPYIKTAGTSPLIFVSGQLPFVDGKLSCVGSVPTDVSIEQASEAARICALNAVSILREAVGGDIDKVGRIVRLAVFVQCGAGFYDQPKVANGASEIIAAIFGDWGKHARAAVGAIALPMNATVELELVAEVRVHKAGTLYGS